MTWYGMMWDGLAWHCVGRSCIIGWRRGDAVHHCNPLDDRIRIRWRGCCLRHCGSVFAHSSSCPRLLPVASLASRPWNTLVRVSLLPLLQPHVVLRPNDSAVYRNHDLGSKPSTLAAILSAGFSLSMLSSITFHVEVSHSSVSIPSSMTALFCRVLSFEKGLPPTCAPSGTAYAGGPLP